MKQYWVAKNGSITLFDFKITLYEDAEDFICKKWGFCQWGELCSFKDIRGEDLEEEEEKPDIVFHCESCKKPIVRDSEDHDFSKCHEEKWYCVDCPCEEEE